MYVQHGVKIRVNQDRTVLGNLVQAERVGGVLHAYTFLVGQLLAGLDDGDIVTFHFSLLLFVVSFVVSTYHCNRRLADFAQVTR